MMEVVFGSRVEEDVEVCRDMEMRELQRACKGEYEWNKFLLEGGSVGGGVNVCWWAGGDAAGEGSVVVDVEFEEVEEGVCYQGDGAVEFYKRSER
jgi:hypothetical protein